ncbi:predicted protein, partial [Naegleria gruberi]
MTQQHFSSIHHFFTLFLLLVIILSTTTNITFVSGQAVYTSSVIGGTLNETRAIHAKIIIFDNYVGRQLAISANGDMYTTLGRGTVRKITSDGLFVPSVAGIETSYGFSGDGGLAIHAQLSYSLGISVNPMNGDVYICDINNHRIRKVSSDGVISTIAGTGRTTLNPISPNTYRQEGGYNGDGLATATDLNYPKYAQVDSKGDVYFADTYNGLIRKVSNGYITTIAGSKQNSTVNTFGMALNTTFGDLKSFSMNLNTGDLMIYSNKGIFRVFSNGTVV